MTIPILDIENAHLELTVPIDEPVAGSSNTVEELSAALKGDFQARLEPGVSEGAPVQIPFVMFQGNNAQFTFSPIQLDYEASFTGGHRKDYSQCKDFMAKKAARLLAAWERVDAHPVWESLAVKLHASTFTLDELASLHHISETLLQHESSDDMLHDVNINFRLRVLGRYNVSIGVGEYERRNAQQQIRPGVAPKPIRPWETTLTDRGLEVVVEVNNRYGALVEKKHTRVTESELRFMNGLTWHIVEHVAVPLAQEGVLNTETLEQVVA
jgi:hypothetical protein